MDAALLRIALCSSCLILLARTPVEASLCEQSICVQEGEPLHIPCLFQDESFSHSLILVLRHRHRNFNPSPYNLAYFSENDKVVSDTTVIKLDTEADGRLTVTAPHAKLDMSGNFNCTVINNHSSYENSTKTCVTVRQGLELRAGPNVTVGEGENATLTCAFSQTYGLETGDNVTWTSPASFTLHGPVKGGGAAAYTGRGQKCRDLVTMVTDDSRGVTQLTIVKATRDDSGIYVCSFNICGEWRSASVTLSVGRDADGDPPGPVTLSAESSGCAAYAVSAIYVTAVILPVSITVILWLLWKQRYTRGRPENVLSDGGADVKSL